MAVTGKGKQIAANAPESSSSGKRKGTISSAAARRKKRRPGVLQFFDEAAVDAGDDDTDSNNEEAEDEPEFDFMADTEMGTEDVQAPGKAHPLSFLVKEEQLSGDELEELIKDRYGPGSEHVVYAKDDKECDDRISEIHDMIETNIWRIKCMAGRERQIVFSIMQKFVDLEYFGRKLHILSVFTLDHVKGFVYVEAGKASDVTEACKGLLNLYLSRMSLVPKTEVPQLLTIRNKLFEVAENAWVRLRSGKYKGDLAQIVAVDENQKSVTLKLIPRVDLQAMSRKFGGGVSLKAASNPAPRLLSSQELEDFRPHIQVKRDRQTGEVFDVLDGLMLKDGFLYKKVSIGSLICWGVQPTKAELLKFSDVSKDKVEDLDWISSIYSGRKKKKDIEASDRKTEANQGDGYELYDLVMFGRKDFGVIISMENHNYEILKCNMGRPEVVTVKQQEIKSCCADKMFTALDREKRTIFIDDVVKVLEGPLEDKQGVVCHMYRGILFIHDEAQVENSGLSCVKSDLCEKIQESRKSYGGKKGGKSSISFSQSPKRSDQDEEFTNTFNRPRERERKETYSIGQTLRIRKGPLKGYLCRVVGVYCSDVTVKLDSLVKVITVEENMLSIPNLKRDEPGAMSFNSFGVHNSHGLEQGADLWDSKALFGSTSGTCDSTRVIDSWAKSTGPSLNADTAWMKPTVGENAAANANAEGDAWDTKAKGLDIRIAKADAWDTKAKGLDIGNDKANAWDTKAKGLDGNDNVDAWSTKAEGLFRHEDAWDKGAHSHGTNNEDNKGWGSSSNISNQNATSKVGDQTESWDKAVAIRSQSSGGLGASTWDRSKAQIIGRSKGLDIGNDKADGWDTKAKGLDGNDKADAWGTKAEGLVRNEDTWDKGAHSHGRNNEDNKGWGRSSNISNQNATSKVGDRTESWDKAAASRSQSSGGLGASNWDRSHAQILGRSKGLDIGNDKTDAWDTKAKGLDGNDEADAWGTKAEGLVRNEDAWDKGALSVGRNNEDNKGWGRSYNISNQNATSKVGDQTESWDKAAALRSESSGGLGASSWDKSQAQIIGSQPENFRWAGGENELKHSGHRVTSWEPKVSGDGQYANWEKPKATSIIEKDGWKKAGSPSQGDMDGWSGSKAVGGGQLSSWDRPKASSGGESENWGKHKNATEGQSGGWNKAVAASSQGQPDGWSKPKGSFGNQISGWNNEHGKVANNRDQPKGFGGCGPSSWNTRADQGDGWHGKKQSDSPCDSGGWSKNAAPSSVEAGGRRRLEQANASVSKRSWGAPLSSEPVDPGGSWGKQGSTVGQKSSSSFTGGEGGSGAGSCDQLKEFGDGGTSGWNAGSGTAHSWNRKKEFDTSSDAAAWDKSFVSPLKQAGGGSGPQQANASGDNGNWEKKTSGWGDAKDGSGSKSRW